MNASSYNANHNAISKKTWFKMLGWVLLMVLVIGGIYGFNLYRMIMGFKNARPVLQTVSTLVATQAPWQQTLAAVGTLRAVQGVDLTVEAGGIVEKIHYPSGAKVPKGAAILSLRAYEDRARVANLRASAALAAANYARDVKQFEINAISQAQMDASRTARDITAAQAQEQEALLNKKIVRAPFAGTLGIIQPSIGQMVNAGSVVASLQATENLFVDFNMPQSTLNSIRVGQSVHLVNESIPDTTFKGKVVAIDSQLDKDTRNVSVRALVNNADKKLWPGMFAKISLELGIEKQGLFLPQTAITYNPYGQTVFVVSTAGEIYQGQIAKMKAEGANEEKIKLLQKPADENAKAAKQIFVTTGVKRGNVVEVTHGLKAGDEVITTGQLKLKNGALIEINNKVQPSLDDNPIPIDK